MFLQSSFTTEYLSELNLTLTQEDYGNRISDLLIPIKSYLQQNQDLLTFSLARYSGADTRLALYTQWTLFLHQLSVSPLGLIIETEQHLREKNPSYLRDLSSSAESIRELSMGSFFQGQLELIYSKHNSMGVDILQKSPYLQRYISRSHLSRVSAAQMKVATYWMDEDLSLEKFIQLQSWRESYLVVCYPVLLGLIANFHQEESPVNPRAIKWDKIEECLTSISALHQTGRGFELERFLKFSRMNKTERADWINSSDEMKKRELLVDQNIIQEGKKLRLDLHLQGTELLELIVLPEKYSSMLKDLLDWSLSLNFVK